MKFRPVLPPILKIVSKSQHEHAPKITHCFASNIVEFLTVSALQ